MEQTEVATATTKLMGAMGLYFVLSYRSPFIVALLFYPEDGDRTSFWNCGSFLPNYTALHLGRH
jgi:hypothetical protein